MSDDNDDAAAWLVSQGLARKGHIAIHGYSYGGFAAFAAAARSSQSDAFRCAVAGAGVADLGPLVLTMPARASSNATPWPTP